MNETSLKKKENQIDQENNKIINIEDYNNKTNKNSFDFLKKHSNILK